MNKEGFYHAILAYLECGENKTLYEIRRKNICYFALYCAKQVKHLVWDKRSLKTLTVIHAYLSGKATSRDVKKAADDAPATYYGYRSAAADAAYYAAYTATEISGAGTAYAAYAATYYAAYTHTLFQSDAAKERQKKMFVDMIFGKADWKIDCNKNILEEV